VEPFRLQTSEQGRTEVGAVGLPAPNQLGPTAKLSAGPQGSVCAPGSVDEALGTFQDAAGPIQLPKMVNVK
jgi:hypothetical protein